MKYAIEMGSGAMIHIPSFIKIGTGIWNGDSSVGVATGYWLRAGRSRFDSWQCKILFSSTASRLILEPTQPHIQWVLGGSFPGGKAAWA
jgi:hypothetical protein